MVQHKPTPEEQLLKLIENPGAQAPGGAKSTAGGTKSAVGKKGVDFGKLSGFFSNFAKNLSPKGRSARGFEFRFDIKLANRILLAMVVSAVVYLVIDFFLLRPASGNFLSQVATSEKVYPVFQDSQNASGRDFSSYEKAIQKRNPFTPPGTPAAPLREGEMPQETAVASTEPVINQMVAGLKLVGISWGDEPLAMIEDGESTRTYFVKKGGEVKGMKVQEIAKEKVTLTYEGQETELF